MAKPRNDRNLAVTKFCLSMEEHRRTDAGRVRTAKEFVQNFFPYDESSATDRVFNLIPNEVRGPILSAWGIRGSKAALKDDDAKVLSVVHDALVAGDIDESTFEEGVTAQTLVDWVGLPDWWSFWRQGKLTGVAVQKALATARELELIDDRWFLANIQGRGGKLKGTDVICDTLSKDQIVAWMRKMHETGDGSPAGMVAAIGWETILAKTSQDALLFALDQFARKTSLSDAPAEVAPASSRALPTSQREPAPPPPAPAAAAPATATVHEQQTEAPAAGAEAAPDSGIPVSVPDAPAEDNADEEAANAIKDSVAPAGQNGPWGDGESPKLVEERARMMEMLGSPDKASKDSWDPSDVPEKPSSLEWPEPPPVIAGPAPAPAPVEEAKPGGPPPLPKKPAPPPPIKR